MTKNCEHQKFFFFTGFSFIIIIGYFISLL